MSDEKDKPVARELHEEEGAGSLDAFLGPTPSPAKPEGDKKDEGADKDAAKKDDGKPDAKADEKKPPADDKKPDAKPDSDDKDKKPETFKELDPDKDKKPDEKPPDDKKPPVDAKPEKPDWDSDDNPYKKRFRDTSNWATNLNQKQKDQDREILILKKKVEGTYDEERDEPKQTPEDIQVEAENLGRAKASRQAAITRWGAEAVEKDLNKFNDIFSGDVHVLGSVASADQPVIEAIRTLRRYEFFEEYGEEPTEIVKKIGEKAVKGAGDTIRGEESKKLADRVKVADAEAKGLAGLAGKDAADRKTDEVKVKPLSEEFDQ